MYSPLEGRLRRTNHEGINFKFTMSETDFAIGAKIGYMQVSRERTVTYVQRADIYCTCFLQWSRGGGGGGGVQNTHTYKALHLIISG